VTSAQKIRSLRSGINWHRARTWSLQDRAGVSRTRAAYAERRTQSIAFLNWIDRLWLERQRAAHRLASRRSALNHRSLWLCIHSGEGAWNANTGNGYYGGLQMTSGWGGVARPDLLSPSAQMQLAERQYRASGYSHAWLEGQWPNTSPPCLAYA
jgi:hypothetical protein